MSDVNELDAITGEVIIRPYTEEEKNKIEELKQISIEPYEKYFTHDNVS